MLLSMFMVELLAFCESWKKELLSELTSQHDRFATEKFLSDEHTEFHFTARKASRTFVSKSRQRYRINRRWVNGKLHPMWETLAAPFDKSRTQSTQEACVQSYRGFTNYWPYEDTDVNEATKRAVIYMIEVQLPLKKRTLEKQCAARGNRIPTHRRNGELHMNGRSL